MKAKRNAFTLVEILIVVVIMAVLAATIIPQFTASTKDAQDSTAIFNLQALRSQIEMYKAQHGGTAPTTLSLLTQKTNADQTTTGTPVLGPYLLRLPENPLNGKDVEKAITGAPVLDTTGDIGWLYDKSTGKVNLNADGFLTE